MKVDCHADTPLFLMEKESLRLMPDAHMDFLRVNKYLDIAFLAVFIDERKYPEDTPKVFNKLLLKLNYDITNNADLVSLLLYHNQLESQEKKTDKSKYSTTALILLVAEGAAVLGNDLEFLDDYFTAGLRVIGPTWNYANQYAGGCSSDEGFSKIGLELITRCNEKGILLDGAHLNKKSFWQLEKNSKAPFIVSHSCCAALSSEEIYQLRRNLDDEQMIALAKKGGVMGITFVADFLGGAGDMNRLCEHIEYAVSLIGSDHVALGSDFDGCKPHLELMGIQKLPNIYHTLASRGMNKKDTDNVAGRSVVNLLNKVLPRK